jgi:hypothetical protein
MSHFSLLLTGTQAAERLGVHVNRVLSWAARGLIPVAAQDEDGRCLFREHAVENFAERLAGGFDPETGRNDPDRVLPCGCHLTGEPARPARFCADATALRNALITAVAFAKAAPDDPFFDRLASVAHEALADHFANGCETPPPVVWLVSSRPKIEA